MSKQTKNVFEKVAEKLDNVLEELQTANSMLFAIGSELFDIGDKIDSLDDKSSKLLTELLKAESDFKIFIENLVKQPSTPKPIIPPGEVFASV